MNDRSIVALFDSRVDADAVVPELHAAGVVAGSIQIMTRDEVKDMLTAEEGGFFSRLFGLSVPEEEDSIYAECVRRGGVLLKIDADAATADRCIAILEKANVVDIDQRAESYRASGWKTATRTDAVLMPGVQATPESTLPPATPSATDTRLGAAAEAFRDTNLTSTPAPVPDTGTSEEVIPVVEEHLAVGKRAVEHGGVRVRTYVRETPVTEQVHLRQEHVTMERRPVAQTGDVLPESAFRDRDIEATETSEEAVVEKRARVTEEIVLRKEEEGRIENVSDTVRHTEVEIDDERKNKLLKP